MVDRTSLLARGIAVLWAVFWLFFFVVESLAWHTPVAIMAAWTSLGLVFLILAGVAWRSELRGGLVLGVAGVLVGVAYALWSPSGLAVVTRLMTALALGVPPIVAGMLFVLHDRAVSAHGTVGGPMARA